MGFNILKSNEALTVNNVNILIYGEPGAGKTSLAQTACKPLTLDFDKGVHRSSYRKDVLVINDWLEINNNMAELIKIFSGYDTIVIDTVDTLLDYVGSYITTKEPRLAYNKLHYYGKLKDEFTQFTGKLKTINKDVIMIAHAKEKDEGDLRIKRPAITGGSYDRVLQIADFVGYLYIKDNHRTLEFNPSDYWVGKNSAQLPRIIIPDYDKEPKYFASVVNKMKDSINQISQQQYESVQLIGSINERIDQAGAVEDFNKIISEITELKPSVKKQLWHTLNKKATSEGYEYDKDATQFKIL